VVICPDCKKELKIKGVRQTIKALMFKCPRCHRIFVLKKSTVLSIKRINQGKILVAHSDPIVMDKITSLLDKNGYQTVTSSDGITAIVKIIKESPFLIVIEGNLPKINGFEVYRRVKTKTKMKETKFIFITSIHEEIDGESPSSCGSHLYIKDYRIQDFLIEKISEMRGKEFRGSESSRLERVFYSGDYREI
jgi:two-component system cell cycle response regulator DivK